MLKNVSIKKIIMLGSLAMSVGHGMEPEPGRVYYHSPVLPVPANRPVVNLRDLDGVKGILNFNADINISFLDETSDDSSNEFFVNEDNVIPNSDNLPAPLHRGLQAELDAAAEGGNVMPENQNGYLPLLWGLDAVEDGVNFDYDSFIRHLEDNAVNEDYSINEDSDDDEDAYVGFARAA